jgi:hypothetical protein
VAVFILSPHTPLGHHEDSKRIRGGKDSSERRGN